MGALKEEIHYTYDDFKLWEGDWELFDGIAVAMSPALVRKHQSIASAIIREFGNQLDDYPECEVLGEVDYKVSDDTVLRPYIAVTCGETNDTYLVKAPEIIVEIISKSTAKRDEVYKFDIYQNEKVRYYIIVYPDDLIAKVYKLDGKRYDKQGDFAKETYTFDESSCKVTVDFEKVFKRFRK